MVLVTESNPGGFEIHIQRLDHQPWHLDPRGAHQTPQRTGAVEGGSGLVRAARDDQQQLGIFGRGGSLQEDQQLFQGLTAVEKGRGGRGMSYEP